MLNWLPYSVGFFSTGSVLLHLIVVISLQSFKSCDGICAVGLPENFSTNEHDDDNDELTQIRESVNDFKVPSYRGPNPPVGDHTYEFRLYALDAFPKVPKKVSFELLSRSKNLFAL